MYGVKGLIKLAEEIAQSGIPERTRKINGKYIQSHLLTKLEGIMTILIFAINNSGFLPLHLSFVIFFLHLCVRLCVLPSMKVLRYYSKMYRWLVTCWTLLFLWSCTQKDNGSNKRCRFGAIKRSSTILVWNGWGNKSKFYFCWSIDIIKFVEVLI